MGISDAFFKGLAVSALALTAATPSLAQEIDIGEVVVTPNRTPTEKAKVGSKVEKVTKEEIERRSQPLALDYLKAVPGIHVASPGGDGQEASVSMRGADKKYIKTLFNGIDISDPSSTQVQTSYQNLLAGGVTSIEVLKGSQSTLYGSDAVAGVIGISTIDGIEQGIHHEITGEYGSRNTIRGGYTLSGANETGKGSLSINGLSTDGISAAKVNGGGAVDLNPARLEGDEYQNITMTFAGEKRLNEYLTIFGAGLIINSKADFDDSGNPPRDNSYNNTKSNQKAGRVGFNLDLLDGRFRNTFSAQMSTIDRDLSIVSGFGPYDVNYVGKRTKADYQGAFDIVDWATIQFGGDYERQQADTTDAFSSLSNSFSIAGAWGQVSVEPIENLTLTGSYRHDEHSVFGGYGTYRFTAAYVVPDWGTRFHASFGTGFRAPSLYELYDPYAGVSTLRPEESRSFDIGVEKRFFGDRLVADITYFQLDTDNLIDYDFSTSRYYQIPGVTKRNGIEASATWAATEWLDLGGSYTYTRTRQPDGKPRPRIPEHDIFLTATLKPAEQWAITAAAHAVLGVTDRYSPSYGTFADVPLKDYVLVDAKISYKPTELTEVYLRGENLLNQKYELVRGYGVKGASVYAGFKAKF
jgi:vitamin B12 transporter